MTWFLRNWDQVAVALGEHLVIAGSALAIAFLLSLAIGIAAARSERVFDAAMAVSGSRWAKSMRGTRKSALARMVATYWFLCRS